MSRNSVAQRLVFLSVLLVIPVSVWSQSSARTKIAELSSVKFTEFAPTISADGKTLIFESNQNNKSTEGDRWELFESRLNEKGVWSEPHPLTAINEKCNFLAGPSLSYDGNTIYFTAFIENVTTSEDIFYSTRLNDKNWSAPISIGAPINTNGYEGFPSISVDGNSLYFSRVNETNEYDKKNKEGCFSIYVSQKKADGSWGDPVALPPSINAGCERDPKIMADNHTLIFSSIRQGGKGKFDMYQSRLQQDGSWSEPQSLDYINSADNDQSPCVPASGDVMYFCSDNDIYSTSIPKEYRQTNNVHVRGMVQTAGSKAPVATEIRVINATTNEVVNTLKNNAANGHYSLILGSLYPYRIHFLHESFIIAHVEFDFRSQESYKEVVHDVELHTDYTLKLDIKDKDLGFGVNSFLSLKDHTGKLIYHDSVRKANLPLNLKLKATGQYAISVNAPLYVAENHTLTFASSSNPEMPYAIALEHEKVKYVTRVTDVSTKQRLKTKVHYNHENNDEVIIAEEGETIYLRKGDRYQVVTSSDKGYLFSSSSIVAGAGATENGTYMLDLTVAPVKVGANLTLNHITFPSNSADLKESSFVELDQIIELLTNNPGISIEISAHTDDVGNGEYNNSLSAKRAQSVLEYLKKKKIGSQRLVAKGYGESRPIAPNNSEINRERNRRVELSILKVD
jgi:outer membrane protein OmpA-like peptidoglycan-associated protein